MDLFNLRIGMCFFFLNIYNFLLEKSFTIRSELIPMKLGTQKINHN